MKKREFIKILGFGALGTAGYVTGMIRCSGADRKGKYKTWAWVHPVEPSDQTTVPKRDNLI